MKPTKEQLDALVRHLVDQGKLVEAGWKSFDMVALPPTVSDGQRHDMRMAFFAGAQHVFGSIMQMLEPGEEPSNADLDRMSKIAAELNAYINEMKARLTPRTPPH